MSLFYVFMFMLRQGHRSEVSLRKKCNGRPNKHGKRSYNGRAVNLTNHMTLYCLRKYATFTNKTFVPMPSHIGGEEDLLYLYSPLQDYLQERSCAHQYHARACAIFNECQFF